MTDRIHRRLAIVVAIAALGGHPASGQFWDRFSNPKVGITITHAPAFPLKLSTIAFSRPQGQCSDEILDTVESMFIENDVEVVDRSHIDDLLREQEFQVSGLVQSATAAKVGELLGAQALIFVKVTSCKTDRSMARKEGTTLKGERVVTHVYTTTADLRGTISVIDLTTGRTLKKKNFQSHADESSNDGYPDADYLMESAKAQAGQRIRQLFFPWSEIRQVVFYDDNDKFCDMEPGYNFLKAGDREGALQASEASYNHCRETTGAKPRMIARAAYNLGVVQCLLGNYDTALATLNEAMRLNAGEVISSAIAECRQAQQASKQMDLYETDMASVARDLAEFGIGGSPDTRSTPSAGRGDTPSADAGGSPQGSIEERLQTLQNLRKKGLIDEKEYQTRRAEILKNL